MGWLLALNAFVAAALAFVVEPIVAKMLLPTYGGSAAVWTTALVFFQAALVAGYAWAHLTLSRLGPRAHAILQAATVVAGLAVLPVTLPLWAQPPVAAPVAAWLLGCLGAMVGLPFLVLSTSGPTMQRWFAALGGSGSGEPYRLFAASNAGSLVGLLAYPTLVEPNLDLPDQARWWTVGFGVFRDEPGPIRRRRRRPHLEPIPRSSSRSLLPRPGTSGSCRSSAPRSPRLMSSGEPRPRNGS